MLKAANVERSCRQALHHGQGQEQRWCHGWYCALLAGMRAVQTSAAARAPAIACSCLQVRQTCCNLERALEQQPTSAGTSSSVVQICTSILSSLHTCIRGIASS